MIGGRDFMMLGLAVLASACGKPGICDGKPLAIELSGNHGHDERIAAKELEKGPGRYIVTGGSHEHAFRLSEGDVAKLAKGDSVELRSTSMNAHVHELRLKCER